MLDTPSNISVITSKDYFYPAAGVTWFWGVAYKF